jgi:hypothetical protein
MKLLVLNSEGVSDDKWNDSNPRVTELREYLAIKKGVGECAMIYDSYYMEHHVLIIGEAESLMLTNLIQDLICDEVLMEFSGLTTNFLLTGTSFPVEQKKN